MPRSSAGRTTSRAVRGGYPEAVRRATPRRRGRFFEGYIADILARDVKQVADIERAGDMRRLVSLLAGQVGGLVNASRLASDLRISAPTVRSYLEILETIYLIRLVPAWSANATTRAIATPKLIFVDSGMAAQLAQGAPEDSRGGLLENFVLGELARQLTWSETSARLYHYRDRDQYEVDGVLEDGAGRIVGIEVKSAETVRANDFRGLRLLQRRVGSRFRAGLVLYCGTQQLGFGDGLGCMPISALWSAAAVHSRCEQAKLRALGRRRARLGLSLAELPRGWPRCAACRSTWSEFSSRAGGCSGYCCWPGPS